MKMEELQKLKKEGWEEDFGEIVDSAYEYREVEVTFETGGTSAVPNATVNGDNLTSEIVAAMKKYCGAVAVSVYDKEKTWKATETLLAAGIKTNWHWILSKQTIHKIIDVLRKKEFPEKLNAIIFLAYKPVGRGVAEDKLTPDDPMDELMEVARQAGIKVGFDACTLCYINRYQSEKVADELIDFCDAGRYSMYVDWDLNASPCSFGRGGKHTFSLQYYTLKEVWEQKFQPYRDMVQNSVCKGKCDKFEKCYSGCNILPINLCKDRKQFEEEK